MNLESFFESPEAKENGVLFDDIINDIIDDFEHNLSLRIIEDDSYGVCSYYIMYNRLETDHEYAFRLKREKKNDEKAKELTAFFESEQKKNEYNEYLRLKKIYGNDS